MLYFYRMETFECPLCKSKVDEVLVPFNSKTFDNCLVLCENEFIAHTICTNGTTILFRKEKSMIEELKKTKIYA